MIASLSTEQINTLDWTKSDGLIPAIVQDASDGRVLMLGYMNRDALSLTLELRRVTFFSRTKNRLWTKGETSSHFLDLVSVSVDCDRDTLLIMAHPNGPTCHTGTDSCFGDEVKSDASAFAFLSKLETVIDRRLTDKPEGSYTAKLWSQGPARMAQKVGEEGVEVALAAVTQSDEKLIGEAADLVFHLSLLLKSRNLSLQSVVDELAKRHRAKA
jgi:phosphoribosyl-ATP pyrophosphohydrolase/phosphoribosyl-AMP cyclohydrolase